MVERRIGRGEGFVWIGMGAGISLLGARTGLGSAGEPGPGSIALATGLFMAGVGLAMMIAGAFGRSRAKEKALPRSGQPVSWLRLIWVAGLLFAYALLLDRLGYVLAGILVLWGLFYDWEKRNIVSSFLLALVVSGGSYIVFVKLLLVRFPSGLFP